MCASLAASAGYMRQVPTETCPPGNLSGPDAVALLEQSSLLVPVGSKSIAFQPASVNSTAVSDNGSTVGSFMLDSLQLGLTG